jgi:hypothetical protein
MDVRCTYKTICLLFSTIYTTYVTFNTKVKLKFKHKFKMGDYQIENIENKYYSIL